MLPPPRPKYEWFFLVYALVYQIFFWVVCALYHSVILLAPRFCRPEITPAFRTWFLDFRTPTGPYEDALIHFCTAVHGVSVVILAVGVLVLLARWPRLGRWGKGTSAAVAAAGLLAGLFLLLTNRTSHPYFLFMGLIPAECLSCTLLLLSFVGQRDQIPPDTPKLRRQRKAFSGLSLALTGILLLAVPILPPALKHSVEGQQALLADQLCQTGSQILDMATLRPWYSFVDTNKWTHLVILSGEEIPRAYQRVGPGFSEIGLEDVYYE